jgi:hypothetical protein
VEIHPLICRLETGNAAFANDFSSWIFKESGVVKVVSSTHHRDDETEPRDQYTKKDPVVSQTSSTAQAEHGYFIPHLVVDKDVGREAMSDLVVPHHHCRRCLNSSSPSTGPSWTSGLLGPGPTRLATFSTSGVRADQQTYTITLAQYTGSSWGPVYLPDLQLDFTMLDPHIRTSLKQVSSSLSGTTYSASFKAPDRHGVFKFVVEYWRPGYVVLLYSEI